VCHVGEREILTVNAALGERTFELAHLFVPMPDVPGPHELETRKHRHPVDGTIHDRLEERLVIGRELEQLDGKPNNGSPGTHLGCFVSGATLLSSCMAAGQHRSLLLGTQSACGWAVRDPNVG
jgi:hypothetical protein